MDQRLVANSGLARYHKCMLTLITLVLFGILAAFFATQNTALVTITLASYIFRDIPLYLIVLASLLLGLVLSSLLGLVNSIASSFTIHGKDVKIKESKQTVATLTKRVHQLELENERLKTKEEGNALVEKKSL